MVRADELEDVVWAQVKAVLLDPHILTDQIEQRRTSEDAHLEDELRNTQKAISSLDGQERRLLRLYGKAHIDERKLDDEMARIRTEKEAWEGQRQNLEAGLQAERVIRENRVGVEEYCRRAARNIEDFTFEDKRMAIDALDTVVWVKDGRATITGRIPVQTKTADPLPDQPQSIQPVPLRCISLNSRTRNRRGSPGA